MHTVQQHYLNGQSSLAVFTKIRHIVVEFMDCLGKAIAAARVAERYPANSEEIRRILADE